MNLQLKRLICKLCKPLANAQTRINPCELTELTEFANIYIPHTREIHILDNFLTYRVYIYLLTVNFIVILYISYCIIYISAFAKRFASG